MDQGSVTWIVTADGAEARVFCERARTGPLRELADLRMAASDAERRRRSEGDQGQHEGELKFLRRVATRLALAAGAGEFERLVLIGPPRTLGLLKLALPPEVVKRIDVTDPHDRRWDEPEALRRHLRDARARSWA
ncbi:MAG TPA: host attachment protein [Phenylobacterium sp.]